MFSYFRCCIAHFVFEEDAEAIDEEKVAVNFVAGLRPFIRDLILKCEEANLDGYLELAKQFELSESEDDKNNVSINLNNLDTTNGNDNVGDNDNGFTPSDDDDFG